MGYLKDVHTRNLKAQRDVLYELKDTEVLPLPLLIRRMSNKRLIRKALGALVDKGVVQRVPMDTELKSNDGRYIPIKWGYTADKVDVIMAIGDINYELGLDS